MLSTPGWVPGARQAHHSHVYKESRQGAEEAAHKMADISRLGPDSKLGMGSHAFRVSVLQNR
jgi:hypothetical protein